MLYHIVAMAQNRVIGKEGHLPWHFSSDLKHFKKLTNNSTVIMGRKTYESIYHDTNGKMLPNRSMVVLTSKGKINLPVEAFQGSVEFPNTLEEALDRKNRVTEDAYIIGGASIFKQTFGFIDGIYLTQIHEKYDGDVSYPEIPTEFKQKSSVTLQENPKLEVIYYEKTRDGSTFSSA